MNMFLLSLWAIWTIFFIDNQQRGVPQMGAWGGYGRKLLFQTYEECDSRKQKEIDHQVSIGLVRRIDQDTLESVGQLARAKGGHAILLVECIDMPLYLPSADPPLSIR